MAYDDVPRQCVLSRPARRSWSLALAVSCLALAASWGASDAMAGPPETKSPTRSGNSSPTDSFDPSRPPLWSFAWLSDMHIGTAKPEFIAKALQQIALARTGSKARFFLQDVIRPRGQVLRIVEDLCHDCSSGFGIAPKLRFDEHDLPARCDVEEIGWP